MAKINRRYIDKHWLMFMIRGAMAIIFGCVVLFSGLSSMSTMIAMLSVFLLLMGIVDSVGALYSSVKKHGWITSVIDALIDVAAAGFLLFYAQDNLVLSLIIIAAYTFASGIIDIFHGFLSTVDPTDRFIRVLAGGCGCVMGAVILNAGHFGIMTFIRFFGAYLLIVGVTSAIYGVHNRAQEVEDTVARSQSASRKSVAKKKSVARKTTKKTTGSNRTRKK